MAVDTAAHIGTLDATLPLGSEAASELDNNFRHIKGVLKTDFPNITGAVTATHTELNYVDGVTSAIQTQIDAKAPIASPTFTGVPAVPTAAVATSSTQAASTAFVQTAIAAVNAASGAVTFATDATTAFSVASGQVVTSTNVAAVAVTFPASPTVGAISGVIFDNGLVTNTIDLGANSITHNGTTISGVLTCDERIPMLLTWGGDYWRRIF